MKHGLILLTVVLLVSMGTGSAAGAADAAVADQPNAVFAEVKHEFDRVVDGTQVTHDFAVKNNGRGVLEISRVKTG